MLIEGFEQAVEKFSGNTAIEAGGVRLSYRQLNERANRLAHALLKRIPENDDRNNGEIGETVEACQAALLFEKGVDMIVSLLAVLKAGMAFVPLDIFYPEKRISYMLEHSRSLLLLTNRKHRSLAENVTHNIVINDSDAMDRPIETLYVEDIPADLPDVNPRRKVSPDHRAYILYTSGSTGNPKGVVQIHRNVLYYIRNWARVFNISAADRMTLLTAFTHDGAMQDIFAALLNGAALLPFDIKTILDRGELSAYIRDREITIWHSVPTVYRYFIEGFRGDESYPRLRTIILGGEPLREHDVELFKKYFPGAVMANVYGQTESSVGTICRIDADTPFKKVILGEPLDETEILLVDENDEIIEDMGAGEIVILSDYLAPCYWQDPEETKLKFTRDPELGTMYWTGDLGAYLGSGDIEILGRKDFQVKIRGFRVETGEIETQLLSSPAIKEAAVLARRDENGDTCLCGYFVPIGSSDPQPDEILVSESGVNEDCMNESVLREYLFSRLPDYMVPSRFVMLEKMPLTASGKIDRKALPEPEPELDEAFVPPETATEKKLADIWQEVLFGVDHPDRKISRRDHFFHLGGHSLRAMTVISGVHKVLNVRLKIEDVFSYPVLADLATYIDQAGEDVYQEVQPVEQREYYPLSSAQMRLFLLGRMEKIGTAYNLPVSVILEGELDRKRLQRVFHDLIRRHESYRTSFMMVDETPVQRIHDPRESDGFKIVDYSSRFREMTGWSNKEDISTDIAEGPLHLALVELLRSFVRPFDLSKPPLIRVGLVKLTDIKHMLMIDIHHIITDGSSIAMLIQELMALYRGLELETPGLRYTDYTLWQSAPRQQRALKRQEKYWLREFSGEVPVLDIPADFARPPVQSFEGRRVTFALEPEQARELEKLASTLEITMFMLLLGLYKIFLGKVSGQEDIVVGAPVAGRGHSELQQVMGMFVNTLAIRSRPQRNKSLKQYLLEMKEITMNAFDNQDYPFEDLVDRVDVNKDAGRNPLFDTVFALQNYDARSGGLPQMEIPGLTMRPFVFDTHISRFDLLLTAGEWADGYTFLLEYCSRLFSPQTMDRFVALFKQVIREALRNPSQALGDIAIISDDEKKKVLEEFNDTATDFPADKTLHQIFEEQAARRPDRIALVTEESHSTYKQVNLEADALSNELRSKGVGPGVIVALMPERSAEMIVTMLAVLKTGAAYMPIDSSYPKERIDYILKDSAAKILMQSSAQVETNNIPTGQAVKSHLERGGPRSGGVCRNGRRGFEACYIIYTSGTTGKPKGTVITHTNVSRVVINTNYVNIDERDRLLQLSNFAFDGSVFDIYGAILNGAALVMVPDSEAAAADRLAQRIKRECITIFFITAALFNTLVEYESGCLRHVQKVIAGGDRMSAVHARKALELLGPDRVLNGYGPTETTVFAAVHTVNAIPENTSSIPIGGPISNTVIYILDQNMNPVPIGIRGEIYIGGPGVGLGYLNNPELTAERFVRPATGNRQPATLYKTGDLGRWLPDGTVEFLGRMDQQVKLRGFRIELGEIENHIMALEPVREAVVMMRRKKDGDAYLCAYLVYSPGTNATDQTLRENLLRRLPEYMVPVFFVALDEIPLTPNGKVDRRALPEPGSAALAGADGPEETSLPRNRTEEQLRKVWAELLDLELEHIGITSDFFRLGGHSLKVVSLVNVILKEFRVKLDLSSVFRSPTIEGLAAQIEDRRSNKERVRAGEVHILPQPVKPYYELSYAQRRIWVLQQLNPSSPVFNISTTVYLEGGANEHMVRGVMEQLVRRHASFRTYFNTVGEDMVQMVADDARVNLEVTGLTDLPENEKEPRVTALLEADSRRVFKLDAPPLYRAKLFILTGQRAVFHFKIHHIIFDGWSLEVLQREFLTLLEAAREGKKVELEPLKIKYTDFVYWQNNLISGEGMDRAKEFWKEHLTGDLPVLSLPYDFTPQSGAATGSAAYRTVVPQEVKEKLKILAVEHQSSLFMVLLAGFKIMLSHLSGRAEFILAIPGAARRHRDLNNVMGLFVNTLILRGRVEASVPFTELLTVTREDTLKVLEFQDFPMELVCEELNISYPELSVFFNKTDIIETKESLSDMESRHVAATQDTKFAITLYLSEYRNGLDLFCCYFSHLFKPETIEKIMDLYKRILVSVANDPGQAVSKTYKTRQKRSFKRKS